MELTYDRLIQFDLLEKIETELCTPKKTSLLLDFLDTLRDIQSIDQFIKDSPSFPGSTDKIIRNELVSAIGATLAIEGTTIQKEEIEESFRKANIKEKLQRKEQEAENSRKVYEFIIELVRDNREDFTYQESMIKQVHKYYTDTLNYLSNTPGGYRGDFSVTFGVPRISGLCKNGAEVRTAMKNYVKWLNRENSGLFSGSIIVKAIMAHYYLSEIHPFGDGNGRTARAVEALVLNVNGINHYCFWSLANFWSSHRDQYLIHLRNIRETCDPFDFILWGMKGFLEEIIRIKGLVLKKVKQLMLMDYIKYLLANKKSEKIKINQRIVDVMSLLIPAGPMPFNKFLNSPHVNALYSNVSSSTMSRDFDKMEELNLIKISEKETVVFIEVNFGLLENIRYMV